MYSILLIIFLDAVDKIPDSSMGNKEYVLERDVSNITQNARKDNSVTDPVELRQRQNVSTTGNILANTERENPNRQTPRSTVKISPLKKTNITETPSETDESLNVSRSTSEAKMMLKHFEFLRIVLCFMAGFLCRKVLTSGYGIFYVQVSCV